MNRDLFLGLYEQETHAAIYSPGSFYWRHHDGFQLGNLRTLTAILYVNPRWQAPTTVARCESTQTLIRMVNSWTRYRNRDDWSPF